MGAHSGNPTARVGSGAHSGGSQCDLGFRLAPGAVPAGSSTPAPCEAMPGTRTAKTPHCEPHCHSWQWHAHPTRGHTRLTAPHALPKPRNASPTATRTLWQLAVGLAVGQHTARVGSGAHSVAHSGGSRVGNCHRVPVVVGSGGQWARGVLAMTMSRNQERLSAFPNSNVIFSYTVGKLSSTRIQRANKNVLRFWVT